MSRIARLLQRFLLLAILVFAAVFCWLNRDTLALTIQLSLWQWLWVVLGYLGCYWLNALMACQAQWQRGTRPTLAEMLVINAYASILGYATVLRAGYYSGKLWFYQQRYGLSPSISLGLQGWVSLLVLTGNAWFGLLFGLWLQLGQHMQLPWVHWLLVLGTLLVVVAVVLLLFGLAEQRWLPVPLQRWLGNIKAVISATSWREIWQLNVQAMLNIPLQALALGVLCSVFGLAIPIPYLLLMAVVANLSLIIALTPANLGIKELVLWQLLASLHLPKVQLLGVMMMDRLIQLLILAVISALGYRLLQQPPQTHKRSDHA